MDMRFALGGVSFCIILTDMVQLVAVFAGMGMLPRLR